MISNVMDESILQAMETTTSALFDVGMSLKSPGETPFMILKHVTHHCYSVRCTKSAR